MASQQIHFSIDLPWDSTIPEKLFLFVDYTVNPLNLGHNHLSIAKWKLITMVEIAKVIIVVMMA